MYSWGNIDVRNWVYLFESACIWWSLLWYLLHVTLLASKVFRWLPGFWKNLFSPDKWRMFESGVLERMFGLKSKQWEDFCSITRLPSSGVWCEHWYVSFRLDHVISHKTVILRGTMSGTVYQALLEWWNGGRWDDWHMRQLWLQMRNA